MQTTGHPAIHDTMQTNPRQNSINRQEDELNDDTLEYEHNSPIVQQTEHYQFAHQENSRLQNMQRNVFESNTNQSSQKKLKHQKSEHKPPRNEDKAPRNWYKSKPSSLKTETETLSRSYHDNMPRIESTSSESISSFSYTSSSLELSDDE